MFFLISSSFLPNFWSTSSIWTTVRSSSWWLCWSDLEYSEYPLVNTWITSDKLTKSVNRIKSYVMTLDEPWSALLLRPGSWSWSSLKTTSSSFSSCMSLYCWSPIIVGSPSLNWLRKLVLPSFSCFLCLGDNSTCSKLLFTNWGGYYPAMLITPVWRLFCMVLGMLFWNSS